MNFLTLDEALARLSQSPHAEWQETGAQVLQAAVAEWKKAGQKSLRPSPFGPILTKATQTTPRFTGASQDAAGRKLCLQGGKHVPCEDFGGEGEGWEGIHQEEHQGPQEKSQEQGQEQGQGQAQPPTPQNPTPQNPTLGAEPPTHPMPPPTPQAVVKPSPFGPQQRLWHKDLGHKSYVKSGPPPQIPHGPKVQAPKPPTASSSANLPRPQHPPIATPLAPPAQSQAPPNQHQILDQVKRAGQQHAKDTKNNPGTNIAHWLRSHPVNMAQVTQFEAAGVRDVNTLEQVLNKQTPIQGGINLLEFHDDASPFVLLSQPQETLTQGGTPAVVVGEPYLAQTQLLEEAFPGIHFLKIEELPNELGKAAGIMEKPLPRKALAPSPFGFPRYRVKAEDPSESPEISKQPSQPQQPSQQSRTKVPTSTSVPKPEAPETTPPKPDYDLKVNFDEDLNADDDGELELVLDDGDSVPPLRPSERDAIAELDQSSPFDGPSQISGFIEPGGYETEGLEPATLERNTTSAPKLTPLPSEVVEVISNLNSQAEKDNQKSLSLLRLFLEKFYREWGMPMEIGEERITEVLLDKFHAAEVTINFDPHLIVEGKKTMQDYLLKDPFLRNLHEVGTSQGSMDITERSHWEELNFGEGVRALPSQYLPKYGAVNWNNGARGASIMYGYGVIVFNNQNLASRLTITPRNSSETDMSTVGTRENPIRTLAWDYWALQHAGLLPSRIDYKFWHTFKPPESATEEQAEYFRYLPHAGEYTEAHLWGEVPLSPDLIKEVRLRRPRRHVDINEFYGPTLEVCKKNGIQVKFYS